MNTCRVTLFVVAILICHDIKAEALDQGKAAAEIAKRSGLPDTTVLQLLQDCPANQQSMTFCAWRDEIVAESKLKQRADLANARSRSCAVRTSAQVDDWLRQRDIVCDRDAAHEAGGSDEFRARSTCRASMTRDYVSHFSAPSHCGR